MNGNFNFKVLEVSGREALRKVSDFHEESNEKAEYPFIIGDQRSLNLLTDTYTQEDNAAAKIIEKSGALNIAELFKNFESGVMPIDEEFDKNSLAGVWKYEDSNRDIGLSWEDLILSSTNYSSRKPLEKCFLGIAPTNQSWQIPAFVQFGGWNSCPSPEEHCAILRFWQEKYGAKVVSLTHDVIECVVSNPPQSEEECWELAWQQYFYCADIVDQGIGSVGALASRLRDSSYWYFWWD